MASRQSENCHRYAVAYRYTDANNSTPVEGEESVPAVSVEDAMAKCSEVAVSLGRTVVNYRNALDTGAPITII